LRWKIDRAGVLFLLRVSVVERRGYCFVSSSPVRLLASSAAPKTINLKLHPFCSEGPLK
jgi:hypothetical protein